MLLRRTDPVADRLQALGLGRAAADRLSTAGTLLDLPAGTTLCREGERGSQAFLLLAGEAEVQTADGPIAVGPGAVLGELATLDPRRTRNATVVATTAVTVLVYDVATFRTLARQPELHPTLAPERAAA